MSERQPDIAATFAAYAANLTYEQLPAAVVSTLKRVVLDTLGTTLAANHLADGVQPLIDLIQQTGGAPESTLLGFGRKVPALMAALGNGGMAQALNYADTAKDAGHLGPSSVPAALAAAEQTGGVSGREFLASLAAGTELMARLSTAFRHAWGDWPVKPLRTQTWGYFNAALCSGRVLKLNASQMHDALGLALMQASGSMQIVRGGDPPAKNIYAAFPNYGGLLSAMLARNGLRAACDGIFEGEAGLFQLFHDGRFWRSPLENGLGETFYLLGVRFKPWPTSGVTHSLIEAALQLVARERLDAADIEQVQLIGGPDISHCSEPVEVRKKPSTTAAAGNSVFFPVAKVLANGGISLADFTPEGLRQPQVLALAQRMTYTIDAELGSSGIVLLSTADGRRLESRADTPLGDLANPMSYEQIVAKFLDCARYAAQPIPAENLQRIVELIDHLEQVPDVAALPALLSNLETR